MGGPVDGASEAGVVNQMPLSDNRSQNRAVSWWSLRGPLWLKDIKLSYLRLWEQPILTWLTCAVIGLSLALPFGLFLLVSQLLAFAAGWESENQMTLYLYPEVELVEAQQLSDEIMRLPQIDQVKLISKQQGWRKFSETTGLGETLAQLSDNPLPHVLVVVPNSMDESVLGPLRQRLARYPLVDTAQLDLQWLQKLNAALNLGSKVVAALALGFSLAVLLVVYNTIRFALEHRIREIEILKQLGASALFIARPYLISGVWLGFIGGVLALLAVQGVYYWLHYSISLVTALYATVELSTVQSTAIHEGITLLSALQLMAGAMLLGVASAAAAVVFELKKR